MIKNLNMKKLNMKKANISLSATASMLVVCIVGCLVAASCGSKKSLVKDEKPVVVQTPGSSGNLSQQEKEKQMQLQRMQFAKKVADNAVYNKCITSKIDFNLKSGSKDITVSGKLQMRRDDVIRIQLNVPILGMEAGRLEFTKDYVMIVDRIHTEYIKGDYNKVDFLKNNGLDFYALQALFWNQLYLPGTVKMGDAELKNFDVTLNEGNQNSVVALHRDRMNYEWQADNKEGLIRQVDVQYSSSSHGNTKVTCAYDDFTTVGVKQFPTFMTLDMNTSATKKPKQIKVGIRMRGVNTDEKWDARTTLSKKYKEVSVDDVLKKLMSL